MNTKETKIKLVVPQFNREQEFSKAHAERLLSMPKNGGWELPKDSKYYFVNGTIRIKANKAST